MSKQVWFEANKGTTVLVNTTGAFHLLGEDALLQGTIEGPFIATEALTFHLDTVTVISK